MRIRPDIKLDYKDVLLEPKRSEITSRKDIEMEREFTFLHSKKKFKGLPIMASNMDGVGTLRNLKELVEYGKFREDLFHRLNVVPIELTSLSSRTEDIPLLVEYLAFLEILC